MIIITSKKEGFRRCGVAHSVEPTEHADDAFTPEQINALHDEPMLIINQGIEAKPGEQGFLAPGRAKDKIVVIKSATKEDLDLLSQNETRVQVLAAIDARRKELEA